MSERMDSFRQRLWAVRTGPPVLHPRVSLRHGHLQWGVGNLKWNELLPVFRPRQSPRGLKPLVKCCRGQRREQAKNGQPWGPSPNRLECSLRDSGRVIVHAENEGRDRINVALGKPLKHGTILTLLV